MAFDEQAYRFGMAPEYAIYINGFEMPEEITQFVTRLEYENADQVVDKISMDLMNPEFSLSERKFILPGNTILIYGGYGKLEFLGAGIVTNVRMNFPQDEMPTISVTAYSKDYFMTQRQPDLDQKTTSNPRQEERSVRVEKQNKVDVWGVTDYSTAIRAVGERYGFFFTDEEGNSTIEKTPYPPENLYQIQGMTDYELCIGLANLIGWCFWVDADKNGRWRMHFKSPKSARKGQKKTYTLRYNDGDTSTLLSFEPEMLIGELYTKISGEISRPDGSIKTQASIIYEQGAQWSPVATRFDQTVEGPISKPEDVKIFMKDFAITIPDVTGIKTEDDLARFLKVWVERHENSFIMASGTCVGLELLRARQVHKIANVGTLYDGDWIFDSVRHLFTPDEGYVCEFHARRIDSSKG
jgi:hypothetical protein